MKAKFFSLLLLQFLFLASIAFSQHKVIAMNVQATPPVGDTTNYGVPVIDSTTVFSVVMNVVLDDTNDIYQLHVKLGSTLHGTQHLSTSFDYGVNGTFGTTSYSQSGNNVELNLGSFSDLRHYFTEVQIEKSDHSFEDAVLFSR